MLVLMAALALAPTPKISAWLVFWNPDSLDTFERRASSMAEVYPEWIRVTADGRAERRPVEPTQRERFFRIARRNKVRILPMASNYAEDGFDAKRVQVFLGDRAKRAQHIRDLLQIIREDGADGIDVDYESLMAADRENFSRFAEEASAAFRAAGKRIQFTLHPKESAPGTWDGPKAQDWARIGKAADAVAIMAYDYSWAGGTFGPIAPNDWAERVMRFASTQIPVGKLKMGVAGYGYDWSSKPGKSLTWKDFAPRAPQAKLDRRSDEWVEGQTHFSGAPAFRAKSAIAQRIGVPGLALWYIGSEEPSLWASR